MSNALILRTYETARHAERGRLVRKPFQYILVIIGVSRLDKDEVAIRVTRPKHDSNPVR